MFSMYSDWETFLQAYTDAPSDIKSLVDSEAIANFVDALASKYEITPSDKRTLIAQVSDFVLSLISKDELAQRIIDENNVPSQNAEELSTDLEQFLINPYRTPEKKVEIPNRTDSEVKSDIPASEAPAAPQNGPSAIESLRTMQGDAERIHGYGAYRRKHPQDADAQKPESQAGTHADLPRYEE